MNKTNYTRKSIGLYHTAYYDENDLYHRTDGPALITNEGEKGWTEYWIHGKRHRLDGPAMTHTDGDICYFENHQKHRHGGPSDTHCTDDGTIYKRAWYVRGKLHRFNAPAVIQANFAPLFYHYDIKIKR